jgi:hypothetical protein
MQLNSVDTLATFINVVSDAQAETNPEEEEMVGYSELQS